MADALKKPKIPRNASHLAGVLQGDRSRTQLFIIFMDTYLEYVNRKTEKILQSLFLDYVLELGRTLKDLIRFLDHSSLHIWFCLCSVQILWTAFSARFIHENIAILDKSNKSVCDPRSEDDPWRHFMQSSRRSQRDTHPTYKNDMEMEDVTVPKVRLHKTFHPQYHWPSPSSTTSHRERIEEVCLTGPSYHGLHFENAFKAQTYLER